MKYNIPDQFMGKPLKEWMKEREASKSMPQKNNNNPINTNIDNPEDYILLEAKDYGKESYSDLIVCKYRLGLNPEVDKAGKSIGLTLQNTNTENNGRGYIGNINWEQALKLNLLLGGKTLNLRQAVDFLALLKSGKAFDGKGNKADAKELENILDEIIKVRNPWRSEWYDADFKTKKLGGEDVLSLNSDHRLQNGILVPDYSEQLKDYLTDDKLPGIDIDYWIKNATSQGMPPSNNPNGKLYYWAPDFDNNSVARFYAGSGWAYLSCGRSPTSSDSALGVRLVVRPKGASSK